MRTTPAHPVNGTVDAEQPRWRTKVLILAAVSLGQFLIQLDLTIVNVALPSIGRSLHGGTSALQWVIDAYSLALACLLLVGGRIGDRSGHRQAYLVGLAIFAAGSGLCALAPTMGSLIGFRVLQGVGAAVELPATLAILRHSFPDARERAQAVGIWAGAAGVALIIGPVLGGGLVAASGWRAVFVVNLPIVAVIAVAITAAPREAITRGAGGVDLPGQVLGTAALAAIAGGAIEGGQHGFGSALTIALLGGGIGSLGGFVAAERASAEPTLPLEFFRRAAYSAANAAGAVMGFVIIGLLFVFALFFQQAQGDSAVVAGLRFLPLTLAFVITGPLAGRAVERAGSRLLVMGGCALMGIGCLLLLRVGAASGYGRVLLPFAIIGVGYGLTSTPMAAAVLGAVPPGRAGMASSTNLTARVAGGVFGVAVLGSLLPTHAANGAAFAAGLHRALAVAAAVAFTGAAGAGAFMRS